MITNALTAWLIHKRWIGDTSAYALFFTREEGLINCLYKGSRTAKKRVSFQPFLPLWLSISRRGEGSYVRNLESTEHFSVFSGDALFSALYINELIHYLLKPFDAHPELFDAYDATMRSLSAAPNRKEVEIRLRRFEWQLLCSCGYHMSLIYDHSAQAIDPTQNYQLVVGEGFMPCEVGISGEFILAFARNELHDAQALKAIKRFMRQAIDFALDGRPIKARELYAHARSKC